MKKNLLLGIVLVFVASLSMGEPSWFTKTPKEKGFFYFAGVGKGKNEQVALNQARGDVFSQIVYMVNASVTANTTMEKYVEESRDSASKMSSLYQKVRAKGETEIGSYEEVEKAFEKDDAGVTAYILIKVPAKEIEAARARAEAEKARKKNNPMGVFAYAVFPRGNVVEVDTIKSTIEELYRNMGFNVVSVDLEPNGDILKNQGRLVKYLRDNASSEIKQALICVIVPEKVNTEKTMGKFKTTSVSGNMTVRLIDLTNGQILSSNSFRGKGTNMKEDPQVAAELAFQQMIQALTKEFLGDEAEGGKKETTF